MGGEVWTSHCPLFFLLVWNFALPWFITSSCHLKAQHNANFLTFRLLTFRDFGLFLLHLEKKKNPKGSLEPAWPQVSGRSIEPLLVLDLSFPNSMGKFFLSWQRGTQLLPQQWISTSDYQLMLGNPKEHSFVFWSVGRIVCIVVLTTVILQWAKGCITKFT